MIQLSKYDERFKDYYYIDKYHNFDIININTNKTLIPDGEGSYKLQTKDGKPLHVSRSKILKRIFGESFITEDIEYLANEEWRQINNSVFFCSSEGRIKSHKGIKARLLKPDYSAKYPRVCIDIGNGYKNYLVHVLVADCFMERPKGIIVECHHCNRDTHDARLSNIVFLTPSEHQKITNELRKLDDIKNGKETKDNTNSIIRGQYNKLQE